MPGRFITFEGIDGAGKSTHVEPAVRQLRASGLEVVLTREPGGTALSESLRQLVLTQPMDPTTELLMMFAARADHVAQVIQPALERGAWVVCDRFTDSTVAYQGGGRQLDMAFIAGLASQVHSHCNPDRTYYFDLDSGTAQQRRQASRSPDRIESEQAAFFDRVRTAYLEIARREPERVMTLDSAQPLQTVAQQLRNDLQAQMQRFGNHHGE